MTFGPPCTNHCVRDGCRLDVIANIFLFVSAKHYNVVYILQWYYGILI